MGERDLCCLSCRWMGCIFTLENDRGSFAHGYMLAPAQLSKGVARPSGGKNWLEGEELENSGFAFLLLHSHLALRVRYTFIAPRAGREYGRFEGVGGARSGGFLGLRLFEKVPVYPGIFRALDGARLIWLYSLQCWSGRSMSINRVKRPLKHAAVKNVHQDE